VLLAASILTVLVVSISALFVLSMKTNAAAGDQTECVALAQERMEALKHVDYDALHNGGSLDTPATGYSEYKDTNGDARNDFLVTWSVSFANPVSGSLSASKLHVAQLDVRCQSLRSTSGQTGKPKVVNISTYRARGVN